MTTSLSTVITSYFTVHLPKVMGYSENTIKSYRDTFILLFNYADEKHLVSSGRITIDIFKKEQIISFLDWLETNRNASVSTRNQRLAALKSFSKYASANALEYMDVFQRILDIKPKKGVIHYSRKPSTIIFAKICNNFCWRNNKRSVRQSAGVLC